MTSTLLPPGIMRTLLLLSTLLLGACAGGSAHMRDVAPEKANYAVPADKAIVVFMRPLGLGSAVQSSVFDTSDGNPAFVSIVSAKTKVVHYSMPGKKRYMVIGESADFMDAQLDAGKIYYALVTPRFGVWKARFSLRPLHAAELKTTEFADWYKSTRWVENLKSGSTWANSHMPSIRSKMTEYLPDWLDKSEKPRLAAGDGETRLFSPGN